MNAFCMIQNWIGGEWKYSLAVPTFKNQSLVILHTLSLSSIIRMHMIKYEIEFILYYPLLPEGYVIFGLKSVSSSSSTT